MIGAVLVTERRPDQRNLILSGCAYEKLSLNQTKCIRYRENRRIPARQGNCI